MTEDYGKYTAKGYDSTERFPTSVLTFATDKQKYAAHGVQVLYYMSELIPVPDEMAEKYRYVTNLDELLAILNDK